MGGPAHAGSPRCAWTAARPGPRGPGRGDPDRPRRAGSRRCRSRRCPTPGRRSCLRVEEDEPSIVRRPAEVGVRRVEERAAERVGGDDVEAPVEDRPRASRASSRAGAAPSDGHATAVAVRRAPGTGGRPGRPEQVEQVGALGLVESQRAGDPVDDALGDAGRVAALEADVVLRRDARQERDLLAPQAGHPAAIPPYVGSPACSGVMRARRVVRNSRISARTSSRGPVAGHVRHSTSGSDGCGGHCQWPSRAGLPRPARGWFSWRSAPPDGGLPHKNGTPMTDKNVWLVTGAGRGLGVDIARAALAAGHAVVATARDADERHRGPRRARGPPGRRPRRHRSEGRRGRRTRLPSSGSVASTCW